MYCILVYMFYIIYFIRGLEIYVYRDTYIFITDDVQKRSDMHRFFAFHEITDLHELHELKC